MVKKKQYSDKEKIIINNRHIDIYNKTLDGIDMILDGILKELEEYEEAFMDLPKSVITVLDFIVSALIKLQKGHRLALGLDKEILSDDIEPQVSIIEGIDINKV